MALKLSFEERRIIGTLVEKAYTTPEQCPLTLNSLVSGCNQKSCRDPVTYFDEGKVLDVLDKLREKGLAVLVRSGGSRVDRWRQSFADVFDVSPKETAILAELILRGPQTDGELRQRASRMVAIDNLAEVNELITQLGTRDDPLVARLSPPGKKRGVKYAHLFYPEDEGDAPNPETWEDEPAASPASRPSAGSGGGASADLADLQSQVEALRSELQRLAERVESLES